MASTIETVLQENACFPPSPAIVKQANISGMDAYPQDGRGVRARLRRQLGAPCARDARLDEALCQVLDQSKAPFFRWFHDGELNASYNCLDRHLKTIGDKTAIIFEADDGKVSRITYKELHREVCRFANALKSHGEAR